MKKYLSILLLLAVVFTAGAAPRRKKKSSRKTPRTTKVVNLPPARTSGRFITRIDDPAAPFGLDGDVIALWQSHGRYFDRKEDRWTWQRSRLMGTVEDLFPQAFVIPFLVPMLENAGAYVMMPRERDTSSVEVVVDADGGHAQQGYNETNGKEKWTSGGTGFGYTKSVLGANDNPFRSGSYRKVPTVTDSGKASTATWTADIPETGEYAVYVSYASLSESATDARYSVTSGRGTEVFEVNQTMGGGTWIYLGTFPLEKGRQPVVRLVNTSSTEGAVVTADAIKIGGGMGNVERGTSPAEYSVSGYPRFTEGARYWLQWAGMPAGVYSVNNGTDDYDDLRSRGNWVNYLAGGSTSHPAGTGLGIPVDLAFALHTDAGTSSDPTETIGTLPIVSTAGTLGNGKSKSTAQTYGQMISDQVVNDIRALHDPMWTQRKLRNKPYIEAKDPVVPTMLLELLSHQNFADMRYGLDPGFRFDVSRAIYKGILKYIHARQGSPYVVEPLPVKDFAIDGSEGSYTLSWTPVNDPLEPTATPAYYIIYERVDDGAFAELAVTDDPTLEVTVTDSHIYSYRVVAGNDGGRSFPSETLALCHIPGSTRPQVTIVNGFTRISGPAEVLKDGHIGFDYTADHGVPYISDILFTGEQTEFRPGEPWRSNDAPGHGASRATHEADVIAGNTFDFVFIHGQAISKAGYPFISSGIDAFVKGTDSPAIVDLILGKQKEITAGASSTTRFKPFTEELKNRLVILTEGGTDLMVSGSYIGYDLFDNPYSMPSRAQTDRSFAHSVLGIDWRQAKATVTGGVKEVRSRYPEFNGHLKFKFNQTLSSDCYAVESPESFIPVNPSQGAPVLRYTENGYVAGTAFDAATHRAVTLGFPFETIGDPDARAMLMKSVLTFLSSPHRDATAGTYGRAVVYPGTLMANDDDPLLPDATGNFDARAGINGIDAANLPTEPRPRRRRPSKDLPEA